MNRERLQRIIRAAAAMLDEDTVVIIGSQSILASFREVMLPDDATLSAPPSGSTKGRNPCSRGAPKRGEEHALRVHRVRHERRNLGAWPS